MIVARILFRRVIPTSYYTNQDIKNKMEKVSH